MTGFPVPVPGWFHVGSKIVVTAGIPSAEAVGHPLVAYLQNILPAGIPSLEAVGTPAIVRGAVILRPTGIPSEEAFGTLVNQNGDFATDLSHWPENYAAIWDGAEGHDAPGSIRVPGSGGYNTGIISEHYPVTPGQSLAVSTWIKTVGVTTDGVNPVAWVWFDFLDASHNHIDPWLASAEIPWNSVPPTVWTKYVSPPATAPANTAYVRIGANVWNGALTGNFWFDDIELVRSDVKLTYFVAPTGIPSAAAFGIPTVVPGATTLIPSGIPSEEAFGTPNVTTVVKPTGIPSGEAFGTAAVTPGPIILAPAGIPSAEAFGTSAVTLSSLNVLFDALGVGNSVSNSGSTLSWSHTATPGSPVVVWAMYANQAGVPSLAATYAGQNMTLVSSQPIGSLSTFYYYLACFIFPAALSGPQTVTLTPGYASYIRANSLSYLNANTFGVPVVNNAASGTTPAVANVPSAVRHMVSNALAAPYATAAPTAYNQTSRWNVITGGWAAPALLGDAPGAALVSFQATQNVSNMWGAAALDMWNAPVWLIGSAAALANTIAFPAHQVGDLLVVCCIDVTSTTGVTKPAAGGTVPAWVDIENFSSGAGSVRIAQFRATGTNHTTGSWGTANQCYIAVAVIRGQNVTTPVGGHATAGSYPSTTANSTAPAITLSQNDGSSLILCFHHIRSNYALSAAPAGYRRQALDPSANRICLNTKIVSTTDGAIANVCTGADFTIASQIEILR